MLNKIILVGRLTADPELRKTNSDLSVAQFTIAVDNTIKEPDGTRGTCFLDARCFGEKAEALCKYTRKGDKIAIDGSVNQRNFIRQDGSKGKAIEILVDSLEFLNSKPVTPENEVEEAELAEVGLAEPQEEPKFDPYTGKPLKPAKKK